MEINAALRVLVVQEELCLLLYFRLLPSMPFNGYYPRNSGSSAAQLATFIRPFQPICLQNGLYLHMTTLMTRFSALQQTASSVPLYNKFQ